MSDTGHTSADDSRNHDALRARLEQAGQRIMRVPYAEWVWETRNLLAEAAAALAPVPDTAGALVASLRKQPHEPPCLRYYRDNEACICWIGRALEFIEAHQAGRTDDE
jgi:hypothetical protein